MAWKVGAARDLPIASRSSWGPEVKDVIFRWAGWPDNPQPSKARRAFLVYNDEDPTLKGNYKLPFALPIDGRLHAIDAGVRAAARRLPQADLPSDVKARARAVIDEYLRRINENKAMERPVIRMLGQSLGQEEGLYRGVISTSRVDRYETVVDPRGLDVSSYLQYGTVLFNHDVNRPIGVARDVEVKEDRIEATWAFDEEDEFAASVKRKVDRGFVRGLSIGFIPKRAERSGDVIVFREAELVEFSVVTVPANPDAKVLSYMQRMYEEEAGAELEQELEQVEEAQEESLLQKLMDRMAELADRLAKLEDLLRRQEEEPMLTEEDIAEALSLSLDRILGKQ